MSTPLYVWLSVSQLYVGLLLESTPLHAYLGLATSWPL